MKNCTMLLPSTRQNSNRIPFLCTVVIVVGLVPLAVGLQCYHCVCKADCEKDNHYETKRDCPSETNVCLTSKGPGDQIAKLCHKRKATGDAETEDGPNGEKYYYCKEDLCNSKEHGGGTKTSSTTEGQGETGNRSWVLKNNRFFLLSSAAFVTAITKLHTILP